tara:strand:- start:443 stop:625 length:183 start_codon:yes stop_codon:yes gene_type:complete
MNTQANNSETSVEFALNNALYRMHHLAGKDHIALFEEYKEWLYESKDDMEVLIIDYIGMT